MHPFNALFESFGTTATHVESGTVNHRLKAVCKLACTNMGQASTAATGSMLQPGKLQQCRIVAALLQHGKHESARNAPHMHSILLLAPNESYSYEQVLQLLGDAMCMHVHL